MDRRLVTVFGGSGFVGRSLVQKLAEDDCIVRAAVRDTEAAQFLKVLGGAGQIVPVPADITDRASVDAAVQDADAVINLVGILYERGRRSFKRIHVDGARTVAEAAKAAGASRLVHMSAIGANPDSPAAYGRTKAAGERAVKDAFAGATIVRPSVVFGPEDDFFNRFAKMAQVLPVLPVFDTSFQPVYVGDVAKAFVKILADPEKRDKTFQLGGPRVISFREVMELVRAQTGRKRWLLPMPLSVARIQAMFLELLPVPPLTRDQVKLLETPNVVPAGALTFRELGIEPTAVEAILPSISASVSSAALAAQALTRSEPSLDCKRKRAECYSIRPLVGVRGGKLLSVDCSVGRGGMHVTRHSRRPANDHYHCSLLRAWRCDPDMGPRQDDLGGIREPAKADVSGM